MTDDAPRPTPTPAPAPSSDGNRDTGKLLDDQLSSALMIIGVTIVLIGLRQPLVLSAGVFLGASGAIVAVRGGNALTRPARVWLWLAFATTVLGELAAFGLDFYENWRASQLLEMSVSLSALQQSLTPIATLARAAKVFAAIAAVAAVVIALRVLRDARAQKNAPDS